MAAHARTHIFKDLLNDRHKRLNSEFRRRANLGESIGYHFQTGYIVVHLRNKRIIGITILQQLLPGIEGRNGCTELVSCLFAQSYPHTLAFRTLDINQQHKGDEQKGNDEQHLYIREITQLVEQIGLVVVDILHIGVRDMHLNRSLQSRRVRDRASDITRQKQLALRIKHIDRNRSITLNDRGNEINVGILVRLN